MWIDGSIGSEGIGNDIGIRFHGLSKPPLISIIELHILVGNVALLDQPNE